MSINLNEELNYSTERSTAKDYSSFNDQNEDESKRCSPLE